jgi:thiosulfate reductase cytochrome b subunit
MLLAGSAPGGVLPVLVSAPETALRGELVTEENGALLYQPQTAAEKESGLASLYILGHDSVDLIDWFGVLVFLGTLAGTVIHGGLRYFAARRYKPLDAEVREVYMYGVYERLWHWLQTLVIFGLIFTGLIIHKPDKFGMFSFRYVVEVHNVLAAILLINAALSAFYHLASGEIQQFLPRPRGFFDQAFEQAKFYLRGIFRGEAHPFEKTRERKLNPLQQITYFGLLNVLLPLQVITGILMWGLQRWPGIALSLGGLPFLAPLHTLVAWLFASFIVMHVYLTTTGHTATANIRAMIMGWDEVEVQGQDVQPRPTEV